MVSNIASIKALAAKGITLTNYHAVTHPSQPNYAAAVGGIALLNNDAFTRIPANWSTIVDLLDAKGVSWSEYQEDMPYSGFEGNYVNQVNHHNDYVRKHKQVLSRHSSFRPAV